MEDVNKRRRISFSLSKLESVLKKSTPGKFAYTCHFQQIGINATNIEKTGIHFKTDAFAPVAVVDAKALFSYPQNDYPVDLVPLWPLLSLHPGQSSLVGIRNDPAGLQHCFLGAGRGSICSCQCFQQLYLESRHGNVHFSQHFCPRLWANQGRLFSTFWDFCRW